MQFGPADWPFLPNEFECIQTVWLFIKMSDWPFLGNTINIILQFGGGMVGEDRMHLFKIEIEKDRN